MRASSRDRSTTCKGDLVDGTHLSQCADLLTTTSPNVMLYAAIDGWRRQTAEHGKDLLGRALALALAGRTREPIAGIDGLTVLEDRLLGEQTSHDLDRPAGIVAGDGHHHRLHRQRAAAGREEGQWMVTHWLSAAAEWRV